MDIPRALPRPTPGQRALVEALARGDHHLGPGVVRVAASSYTDPDRFVAEQAALFDRLPLVLGPSALLASRDQAVAHDDYRRPLLLTRDHHGRAHVLANVCRHRGTRLVGAGDPGPARRIVCPYHAWNYRPDGELAHVPRADCFPGLRRADHRLAAYPVAERGGLIWFSPGGEPDFGSLAPLDDDFDAFGLADLYLYRRHTHAVAANWKLVIDAFLESYHVQRLHAGTIAAFFADGVTVADRVGHHQRAAVGRAASLADIDHDDWAALRGAVTFTYHLFPNTVLIVSPDYINLLVVMPQSVGASRVEDYMLIHERPASNAAEQHWQKSWDLLDGGTFGTEDFGAAARAHEGLASGSLDQVILGRLEHGIADFHRLVEAAL